MNYALPDPDAVNSHGEFKFWLHIWLTDTTSAGLEQPSFSLPWPFNSLVIDPELLIAHAEMTDFAGWPKPWRTKSAFRRAINWMSNYTRRNGGVSQPQWCLTDSPAFSSVSNRSFMKFPSSPIPQEVLNAFARSD